MLIDGKAIADTILTTLTKDVETLKDSGINPTLAVILVGDDPASLTYIKQKQKAADAIGANVVFSHLPAQAGQSSDIRPEKLQEIITTFNSDKNIHGVIIQRPVSLKNINPILHSVLLSKDVDGFLPNSPYNVPVALAVHEILKFIHIDFHNKHVVVIGRGETAGKPIATHFTKLGCNPTVIHSTTPNTKELMKSADIIVSCVGKERVVTSDDIKQGVILISVGIWRDSEGKLHGDYDETDIQNKASYYTPTPKGVGPVNVACLMQNLVKACMLYVCPPSHKALAGLRFANPKQ